ncbi:hypothetical protein BH10ACI1_BH10ACI1_35020 [soil metagenome]
MSKTTQNNLAFSALEVRRKVGNEYFISDGKSLNLQLADFWKWSVSDLVSNATRGILAEFLVASALGASNGVRNEWDPFDVLLTDGTKLEVKSAAYLQSWAHSKLSKISFTIRQTYAWDSETNKLASELRRQSDIYIFCLLKHLDKETVNPMNLDQWQFYLLPSKILDEKIPQQKTISLAKLLKLEPCVAKYGDLAACVKKMTIQS